jgi:citrate synthase
MALRLSDLKGDRRWYELTEEVRRVTTEEFARRKHGEAIWPNVDFYTPTVYTLMGIPTDMFTAIFAVARVVGWAAHVIEEKFAEAQPKPALYRPTADYVGHYCGPEGCPWVPIDKR